MFPSTGRQEIERILAEVSSVQSAIDILLKPKKMLCCLLKEQQARIMDIGDSTELEMFRACIPRLFIRLACTAHHNLRRALQLHLEVNQVWMLGL